MLVHQRHNLSRKAASELEAKNDFMQEMQGVHIFHDAGYNKEVDTTGRAKQKSDSRNQWRKERAGRKDNVKYLSLF